MDSLLLPGTVAKFHSLEITWYNLHESIFSSLPVLKPFPLFGIPFSHWHKLLFYHPLRGSSKVSSQISMIPPADALSLLGSTVLNPPAFYETPASLEISSLVFY